jgi:hypothetical protein
VCGGAGDDVVRFGDEAARVDEFDGVEGAAADVALVSAGVLGEDRSKG